MIPGDDALFTCIAFSTVDFNLTWVRFNSTLSDYMELEDNAEVFANGSLIIRCHVQLAFSLSLSCKRKQVKGSAFVRMDPVNIPAKFEVRSFSRS